MNQSYAAGIIAAALLTAAPVARADVDPTVLNAERERIEAMSRAMAPSIAIFAGGQGGGSGVIISSDGYALSNFHVTSAAGVAMKCGLSDGGYYDAVLVGLDPTGDVALIKLLGRERFPAAEMADSDLVRQGDAVFAIGNPFLLATNLQPSISYGIVSGVHRYQYPAGTILEYADCIQTDAAINPGNSGGPLFNSSGQLIGINGRGSFEKRGRVNVGVGYAISINQIKHFLGCLKGGRIVDHATLGATVAADNDGRILVSDILEESDAYQQGLRYNDEIVRFADRRITSVNAFKNVLGTLPKDWRVPLVYRRRDVETTLMVRLAGVHRSGELEKMVEGGEVEPPGPQPDDPDRERKPDAPPAPKEIPAAEKEPSTELPEAVKAFYEAKSGYANYHFNRVERDRVWKAFQSNGDFSALTGTWSLSGDLPPDGGDVQIDLGDAACACTVPAGQFGFALNENLSEALDPPKSGGMLAALSLWRRLLVKGPAQFGDVTYLGAMPLERWGEQLDVFAAMHAGVECRFYFDPATGKLAALEFYPTDDAAPCRLHFREHLVVDGRHWPSLVEVSVGNSHFGDFRLREFKVKPPMGNGT